MAGQMQISQRQTEVVVSVAEAGTVVRIAHKAEAGISLLVERLNGGIYAPLSLQDNIEWDFDVIGIDGAVEEDTGLAAFNDLADIVVVQQFQADDAVGRLQLGGNHTVPDFLRRHILHGDRGAPGPGKMLQLQNQWPEEGADQLMVLTDQEDGGGVHGLHARNMGAHHFIIHEDRLIQYALAGLIGDSGAAVQGLGNRVAG